MKRQIPIYSVLLLVVAAVCVTIVICSLSFRASTGAITAKTAELEQLLDEYFIEDFDKTKAADAAAAAVVASTGDMWSYYIPARSYEAYLESAQNAYVGIGITIDTTRHEQGFRIISVSEGGPAAVAGLLADDIITAVNANRVKGCTSDDVRSMIRGEAGTELSVTVLRGDNEITFTLIRASIVARVAQWQMLDEKIGYIKINNFENNACSQTLEGISQLLQDGAEAIVFDVRSNPGGKRTELVKLLDYLLPEGVVFRSEDHEGKTSDSISDEACLDIPMAVLVNDASYSAAEFFAAALQEYDWAEVVGEKTIGKGNYQVVFPLSDGSAVGLSIGRYYTPNGVSLAGVGIVPDITVPLTEEQRNLFENSLLPADEDPQLCAAVEELRKVFFQK